MGKNNKNKRKRSLSSSSQREDNGKDGGGGGSELIAAIKKKLKTDDNQGTATHPKKTKKKSNTNGNNAMNPLYEKQRQFLSTLQKKERQEFFSSDLDPERRGELWMSQADLGEELVNKYAWATPDPNAIKICKEFSPLLEIGCGANAYWCNVLAKSGVDIIGRDIDEVSGGKIAFGGDDNNESGHKKKKKHKKGKKSKYDLQQILEENSDRTLFLCYPDDEDQEEEGDDDEYDDGYEQPKLSMAAQCLQHYTGQYVIHVGELFLDANYSLEQAPWGRSSSPEFQQLLAQEFHCLLKVELQNWLHVRDTISVWKRSEQTSIVFGGGSDDDEDEDDEDEVIYKHIPIEERLPMNIAAPCLAHLLPKENSSTPLSQDRNNIKEKMETKSKQSSDDGFLGVASQVDRNGAKTRNSLLLAGAFAASKVDTGEEYDTKDDRSSASVSSNSGSSDDDSSSSSDGSDDDGAEDQPEPKSSSTSVVKKKNEAKTKSKVTEDQKKKQQDSKRRRLDLNVSDAVKQNIQKAFHRSDNKNQKQGKSKKDRKGSSLSSHW